MNEPMTAVSLRSLLWILTAVVLVAVVEEHWQEDSCDEPLLTFIL